MDKSKKVKRVNFSVEKIRPITRKNRITGTQDDSDSDSDSDSNIGSDYEKPFSPPPSPFPYDSNNDSPIKPSSALLEKKVFDSALRQIEKEIYHPIVVVYNSRNPNGYYSPEYNDIFNQYLAQNDIQINNSTSIAVLEDELITMFEDKFKKEVTTCDFIRTVVFNKNDLLGDYSQYIQDWGSNGQLNYFYINVMLKDMPSDSQGSDANTVIMEDNFESDTKQEDPHDGGSRKRRKGISGRKKTNKKKTNKKKTNKKKTNKKKTNKRKKTNKKRKTIRKRK